MHPYRFITVLPLALLLLVELSIAQQRFWTQTAGPEGAEVDDIITSAKNDLIAGTAQGLYRSSDEGASWHKTDVGIRGVRALGRDSANALYAGTDDGFYRSTDDGVTWQSDSVIKNGVHSIVTGPDGTIFLARFGVYRSTDGGRNWTRLEAINAPLYDIELAVGENGVVYAGFDGKILRSIDRGNTWKYLLHSNRETGAISAIAEVSSSTILVVDGNYLFRTTDAGTSWSVTENFFASSILVADDTVLYASMYDGGVRRSSDYGKTWSDAGLPQLGARIIIQLQNNDLLAGTTLHGAFRSSDNGRTWSSANAGMIHTTVTHLLSQRSNAMLAGCDGGLYRTTDRGVEWRPVLAGNSSVSALAATSNEELYVGMDGKRTIHHSTDNGLTWQIIPELSDHLAVQALIADSDGTVLAAMAQQPYIYPENVVPVGILFRSTNHGLTWDKVLSDANVYTLYRGQGELMLAGSENSIYRSTDRGSTWIAVSIPLSQSLPYLPVCITGFAMNSDNVMFATAFHGGGLIRSTDGGLTWDVVNTNLYAGDLTSIIIDAADRIIVGGRDGCSMSTDDGATWTDLVADDSKTFFAASLALDQSGFLYTGVSGGGYPGLATGGVYRSLYTTMSVPVHSSVAAILPQLSIAMQSSSILSLRYSQSHNGHMRLSVLDMQGREMMLIHNGTVPEGIYNREVNVSLLPEGMYFLQARTSNEVRGRQFVVIH